MITPDDVAGAIVTRFGATSGTGDQFPGGLWYDRGPDNPGGYPYAVFEVTPGDAEITTGDPYIQVFTVRIAAYVQMDGTYNPNTVTQTLNSCYGTTAANTAMAASTLRNAGDKILGCKPTVAEGRYAPKTRQGQDVFLAGATYEVMTQGTRGAT